MANFFRSMIAKLQNKTVTAGTSNKTVTADAGYDGLGTVTVEPTPSTSITPSNSSPASMTSGTRYTPSANGYAIASYTSKTPSSSPSSVSSGSIYKMDGSGYLINNYSSSSKSPSSSGTSFSSGWNYMTSSGYAYSSQPSSGYSYGWNSSTTLWSNSSPSNSFSGQDVTLSSGISSYNYLKFVFNLSTSNTLSSEFIISTSKFTEALSGNSHLTPAFGASYSNVIGRRTMQYVSNTSIKFSNCTETTGTTRNAYCIPTYIYGLK